jgi:hypothetical protein
VNVQTLDILGVPALFTIEPVLYGPLAVIAAEGTIEAHWRCCHYRRADDSSGYSIWS